MQGVIDNFTEQSVKDSKHFCIYFKLLLITWQRPNIEVYVEFYGNSTELLLTSPLEELIETIFKTYLFKSSLSQQVTFYP